MSQARLLVLLQIVAISIADDFNNKYVLIAQNGDWSSAGSLCQSQHATDLASLHSTTDYVEAKIDINSSGTTTGAWIGLNDIVSEGNFVWSDGTSWDYATQAGDPWFGPNPDNDQNNENCVEMAIALGTKLNDANCGTNRYALCNYPSELCDQSQWSLDKYDVMTPIWSGCDVSFDAVDDNGWLVMGGNHWTNSDGVLRIDYIFSIISGGDGYHAVLINYIDICNYYYLGVKVDSSGNNYLFIGRKFYSQHEELMVSPQQISVSTEYILLRIEITNGVAFRVSYGNSAVIYIESDQDSLDLFQNPSKQYNSGIIGIISTGLTVNAKSFYVSGTKHIGTADAWQMYNPCFSPIPTKAPTESTTNPTKSPQIPTEMPSFSPSRRPTDTPSESPSSPPTPDVTTTQSPSETPTANPTNMPTFQPTTAEPTDTPTIDPSNDPTSDPSANPTMVPSDNPTFSPTFEPSIPSMEPTYAPTTEPTLTSNSPTRTPSNIPTTSPSYTPTMHPVDEGSVVEPTEAAIVYQIDVTIILSPPQLANVTDKIIESLPSIITTLIADDKEDCIDKHTIDSHVTDDTNTTIISTSIQVCDEETQDLIISKEDVIEGVIIVQYPELDVEVTIVKIDPDYGATNSDAAKDDEFIWIIIGILAGVVLLCIICVTLCMFRKRVSDLKSRGTFDIAIVNGHGTGINSMSNPSSVNLGEQEQGPGSADTGSSEIEIHEMDERHKSMIIQGTDETMGGEFDNNNMRQKSMIIQGNDDTKGRNLDINNNVRQKSIIIQGDDSDGYGDDEILVQSHGTTDGCNGLFEDEDEVIDANDFVTGGQY